MDTSKTFLLPEQHYTDRYDLLTIKECLYYYQSLQKKHPEVMKLPNPENVPEEKLRTDWLRLINITIHSIKLSYFKDKKNTINKWMESDRIRQETYDNAKSGEYYCENCNVLLDVISKESWEEKNTKMRMSFMYECPRCHKREIYYENGQKWERKPTLCEKCGSEIEASIKIDNDKDTSTWTYKCTGCDYKKVEIDDHKQWRERYDKEKAKDEELLKKFRKEFCFSEEEGNEAVRWMDDLERLMKDIKKDEDKKQDPAYQKAISLKKLKVVELNNLVKEALEKEGYIELQFEKPELGKFPVIPFLTQDAKTEREEYDSKQQLKKLINKVLEETNWRLMSEGISYRVGYLSGRLRCYESEEDLVKLMRVQ